MEVEIEKNLKEIKKFIIKEMKNESAGWVEHSDGEFSSKWVKLKVTREMQIEKIYFTLRRGGRSHENRFELSEIGLSKFRYNYLLNRYVRKFIKNADVIRRKKFIADEWNNFVSENKDLNRDRKLEEIGI